MRYLLLSVLCVFVISCQTAPYKAIQKVKDGTPKYDVLESMGDPQSKKRSNNTDKWFYRFQLENGDWTEKEIDFQGGFVTYVGDPIIAKTALADEVDKNNETKNEEQMVKMKEAIEEKKVSLEKFENDAKDEGVAKKRKFKPID